MTALVMIVGPQGAAPFLSRVRDALVAQGMTVEARFVGEAAFDDPIWPQVAVLVSIATSVTAAVIDRGEALRAIVVPSLGYEGVDVAAASARGIVVANGQVAENVETVAEAAVMFLLMAFYDVHAAEQRLRDGVPRQGPPRARMLKGKTIGIIGHGNIARALIARLAGWGVRILVHARRPIETRDDQVEQVGLDDLLARSDAIVPLVPLTPETHHLLDRARLLQARQGAILVNLSRGAVIDEGALADPTVASRFHAVALDVFETEPLPATSPLRDLPNAILTPHEIAHTAENLTALFDCTIRNVATAVAGRLPATAINPEAYAG